ncbi:MAG TPA: PmoA family protein [Tepidisphaeraceae bacterium]|jgi:hypothetical protein|nr:PmoA family protein [Tepidisphaeraceae bacterium]
MPIELLNDEKAAVVTAQRGQRTLFQYNYAPTYDPKESRKPFLHPVSSLAGAIVTGHPPKDHSWHRGIQMTCANLRTPDQSTPENFWGGPTYLKGKYVQLDNNGIQRHDSWESLKSDNDTANLDEHLTWITAKGESWIKERRQITIPEVNDKEGYWSMDWRMLLQNIHTKQLLFGSPTTAGRPNAGYGGLFWRGPQSFLKTGGQILAGNGLSGPSVLGQRAPWLAYIGAHDSGSHSTLLFIDRPGNPDYPNQWFVRLDPFPIASFSFSYNREIPLDPGQGMLLQHRILFANNAWTRDQIESYLTQAGLHD